MNKNDAPNETTKVKILMAPVPYGLGGYHQVKTYWVETSNG
jgi:hypothetical protein